MIGTPPHAVSPSFIGIMLQIVVTVPVGTLGTVMGGTVTVDRVVEVRLALLAPDDEEPPLLAPLEPLVPW